MADEALFDTFTDTDGTALSSHTAEIGGAWSTSQAGKMTIQSGTAQQTTAYVPDNVYSLLNGGVDNGVFSVDFTTPGSGTWAFLGLFRSTSNHSSFYGMRLGNDTAGSDSNGKYLLDETFAYIQGVSPTSLTISNSATYHIDIWLTGGNELTVNLNGTTILHRTGLTRTGQNYWGFATYSDGGTFTPIIHDNFAVSPLWRPMMFGLPALPKVPVRHRVLPSLGALLDVPPAQEPEFIPPQFYRERRWPVPRRHVVLPIGGPLQDILEQAGRAIVPPFVPKDPKLPTRGREHEQRVSGILNSLLRQRLLVQTGVNEYALGYQAGDRQDWSAGTGTPTTVSGALDRLAALIKDLNGGIGA